MGLTAGTRLGPYEIVAPIGAGGMGEVYRAIDTRLDRTVAIKVLNSALVATPDLKARFEREARTISQLNHPNICTLHDIGHDVGTASDFLVMEFIEGETLDLRIQRGPLPLDQIVKIGSEIADALERAHRSGIVHRDLKPGNVMLTKSGAKLLDFGLAKPAAMAASSGMSAPLVSAAVTVDAPSPQLSPITSHGTIVGTVQYMSPQQIEGKEADARSDIFSLGAVLYEMATGAPAFQGKSQLSVASAILEKEPEPISVKRPSLPSSLGQVVSTCLAKNPDERYQSALDVKLQLQWIGSAPAATAAKSATHASRFTVPIALAACLITAAAGWWIARTFSSKPASLHLAVPLVAGTIHDELESPLALSPDGNWIVYIVRRDGKRQLYLRNIHAAEGNLVAGTEDAEGPFFSPDNQWIGFGASGDLKKVPISGGSVITICGMSSLSASAGFIGGDWNESGEIVFIPDYNSGMWLVSANGGTPQLALATDSGKDRIAFMDPHFLPRNKGIIFTQVPGSARTADDMNMAVLPTGATESRILVQGSNNAHYLPTGQILYGHGGQLLVVNFDLANLQVNGTATPVVSGLQKGFAEADFAISKDGTLLYAPAVEANENPRLISFDRSGNSKIVSDENMFAQELAVSPNGRYIATRIVAANDDIWTIDLAHGTALRLTFEPGDELFPQWTPDGSRIAYGSRIGKIYWRASDGSGQREEISSGEYTRYPWSFSPDGKWLAFVEDNPKTRRDIYLLPLEGDRKPQPFQVSDADEFAPKFSPNGRWIVYTSNETGRNEIYLRPLNGGGGRRRISPDGGEYPVWNRNGRELFYLKGTTLVAMNIDADGNPEGTERVVISTPKSGSYEPRGSLYYDVAPDGQHFIFALRPSDSPPTYYNVITNFFEEAKHPKLPNR